MDRNQVIGFVLIFLILVVWSIINQPTEEEIQQAKEKARIEQNLEEVAQRTEESSQEAPVSTQVIDTAEYGIFSDVVSGQERISTLSNDLVSLDFSSKGGRLVNATLNDYLKLIEEEDKKDTKIPVQLFEDDKNRFNYKLGLRDGDINTEALFFTPEVSGNTLTYKAQTAGGGYIEQKYTLAEDGYNVDYSITFNGLQRQLGQSASILLEVENHLDAIEQNVQFEKIYSTVYFKEADEDSDYCSCRGESTEKLENKQVEWASFVNQFFNTSIIAKDRPFEGLIAMTELDDNNNQDLKKASAYLNIPYDGGANESFEMLMYVGPNEYKRLRAYDTDLEEIIPFGRSIFGDINRLFVRPFFDWLSQFISSKGMVIIVLIFIIKMALYPLTYKMLHSQAKMGALKPQLAGLKDKYKDDAQKSQMETMKVYREYGVSPFGGCFPMIAQIPIWYALFRFFPASITFRQEAFLWAHDLSSYDVFLNLPFEIPAFGAHLSLFTILWAITQVIYTYYNSMHMDMTANPAMKYVQYLMPIMFLAFFNSYASGLTCYMLFSTIFNIAQTVITKKFVFNEEKILAELNIQKAKPKKKNSFQSRLEDAMKRQQEQQRLKESQKKKKKS